MHDYSPQPIIIHPDSPYYRQASRLALAPSAPEPMAPPPASGMSTPARGCGTFYPDPGRVCSDPERYLCAGGVLMPSVFFMREDMGQIIPMVGPDSTNSWFEGDFQTVGPLTMLRSAFSTLLGLTARTNFSGLIAQDPLVLSPVQSYPVFQVAPPINAFGRAYSAGFALQLGTTLQHPPAFALQITTIGFGASLASGDSPPLVDRSFTINIAPWMYQGGWIIVPFASRSRTDTGEFLLAADYRDPARINLTLPAALYSSVYFTNSALLARQPFTIGVLEALERWALRMV